MILFDWGETLIEVPGMIHSPERHLSCVAQLYFEAGERGAGLSRFGIPWLTFRSAYLEAARKLIARSRETSREHRFEDRFLEAFRLAGLGEMPGEAEITGFVSRLGLYLLEGTRAVEGAQEVIPVLAGRFRLGIVSNYPYAPLVAASLEKFAMKKYFSVIVVSGETGWLKPHPSAFREALVRMGVSSGQSLFVGDDLRNDVKGPKAMGFRTAWFAPGAAAGDDPDVDVRISDLRELPAWCTASLDVPSTLG